MKGLTVYMVTVDTYEGGYGTVVELLGIFLARETAEDKARLLKLNGHPYVSITEVELSKTYPIGNEDGNHIGLAFYIE